MEVWPLIIGYDFADSGGNFSTDAKYSWTQEQQGWILSSFYIGYVLSHGTHQVYSFNLNTDYKNISLNENTRLSLQYLEACLHSALAANGHYHWEYW